MQNIGKCTEMLEEGNGKTTTEWEQKRKIFNESCWEATKIGNGRHAANNTIIIGAFLF